jgi:phytoene synthase
MEMEETKQSPPAPYASAEDYAYCRALHRLHGRTYYFASRRFPEPMRSRVDAVYGFVREADEWVDNPGGKTPDESRALLRGFRQELLAGVQGQRPESPAMRAFCDTVCGSAMPLQEPMLFLDAMEMDLDKARYADYAELEDYMRGSAAAVGLMMTSVMGLEPDEDTHRRACCLGNAMQLTNFIRDVAEDWRRGRIYLPLEDLDRFKVSEKDIAERRFTPEMREMIAFQIDRARALYAESDPGIERIPSPGRLPVRIARVLYSRILDRLEAQDLNIFAGRARTSLAEKAAVALREIRRERQAL